MVQDNKVVKVHGTIVDLDNNNYQTHDTVYVKKVRS